MRHFEMQQSVEPRPTSDDLVYAQIIIRANYYFQYEHQFRVSFWALVANLSGLDLGIHAIISFLMRFLNAFENKKATIMELFKYLNLPDAETDSD